MPTQEALFDRDDAGAAEPRSPFRPIHYLGNKSRALHAISAAVDELAAPGSTVCDLFSGSGVVTAGLARHHRVIAADVQEYARVLAEAALRPRLVPVRTLIDASDAVAADLLAAGFGPMADAEEEALRLALEGQVERLADIVEHGSLVAHGLSPNGVPTWLDDLLRAIRPTAVANVSRYYGGVYFSYRQTVELDALRCAIAELDDSEKREVALAALLSTASEVGSTVGNQFAQPVRTRSRDGAPKNALLRRVAQQRRVSVHDVFVDRLERLGAIDQPPYGGVAWRRDFTDAISELPDEVRVVYADPPYTRDHYSRFYHVLETLAVGDDPGVSVVHGPDGTRPSRGLYRLERHQSPFSIISQVGGAFDALFDGVAARSIPLILSYSPLSEGTAARPRTRLMTIEELEKRARRSFATVERRAVGTFSHSKLNTAERNAPMNFGAEILLVCRA